MSKALFVNLHSPKMKLFFFMSGAKDIKDKTNPVADLTAILKASRPKVVYTHNLADKHDTHVSVALRAVAVLRALPEDMKPERVYGCEVWRALDWLPDDKRSSWTSEQEKTLRRR